MGKKSKVVVIGAGMAGLTAANRLYKGGAKESFEVSIVEGGERIGGRVKTTEFGGNTIEMGATWIHGIGGSPIHEIAQKINSLQSEKPWECMDDDLFDEKQLATQTRAEGGLVVGDDIVDSISSLYETLMSVSSGKLEYNNGIQATSLGSFLRHGLQNYWDSLSSSSSSSSSSSAAAAAAAAAAGEWSRNMLEEAVFGVFEDTERVHTGASDLFNLDYAAESEYRMFPGAEITIPGGYSSIIDALASVLPQGMIQLGKRVVNIEWMLVESGSNKPVRLHFCDGSVMEADHVIVTVSLGVLKAGVVNQSEGNGNGSGLLFSPPLPQSKKEAISRLGYGVVNKLFLQSQEEDDEDEDEDGVQKKKKIPFMKMAFHGDDSELRNKKIPWWMRKTASIYPIYNNSKVIVSWFAGEEALELECLQEKEIIDGVSRTLSSFVLKEEEVNVEFKDMVRSKWGTDPLYLGSYSYAAVGCSGDDFDTLAMPLPLHPHPRPHPPLQILFAGEATHRTHYSTTHGAYFSGLREANRLLQHYNYLSPSNSF